MIIINRNVCNVEKIEVKFNFRLTCKNQIINSAKFDSLSGKEIRAKIKSVLIQLAAISSLRILHQAFLFQRFYPAFLPPQVRITSILLSDGRRVWSQIRILRSLSPFLSLSLTRLLTSSFHPPYLRNVAACSLKLSSPWLHTSFNAALLACGQALNRRSSGSLSPSVISDPKRN